MNATALVFALVSWVLGPQPPQPGAVPHGADARLAARVAGCYALEPGPWQRDVFLGQPYPAGAPTRFRLTAERFVVPAGERGATPAPRHAFRAAVVPGPDADHVGARASPFWRWEYWRRGLGDTLGVTRVDAFAGVDLVLAPDGRDLAGRIEVSTDVRHPGRPYRASRPVRARRVRCAPEPARADAGAA